MWCREISEHGGHETSGLVRSEGGRVHGHEENGYGMEVAMYWGFTRACMKWTRGLGREMNTIMDMMTGFDRYEVMKVE